MGSQSEEREAAKVLSVGSGQDISRHVRKAAFETRQVRGLMVW